jgi:phosphoribosylglycinamide formyltransferase 2
MKKIMILGSGELGKELVIALKRLGQYVIAVDNYDNAPAMQMADEREVINMLNGSSLDAIVEKHQPAIIIPEVEAIKTERFYDYAARGIQIVPSAKAANFTMNRRAIRDLAAKELGLKTAPFQYADSLQALKLAVNEIGFPCLVKPLMSSSGKGQSTLFNHEDVENAWEAAIKGSRGDLIEVIVEGFVQFDLEITLLTVTTNDGKILFCPPIGHRQERGDYQESWQPAQIKTEQLEEAKAMATAVTNLLGGSGIWGVEFFIAEDAVYFSELSPRPHDTGMVTLAGTQNMDEFELHARAVLGLPIHEVTFIKPGASAVILASQTGSNPEVIGLKEALSVPNSLVRIFGKPSTRPFRRMGVSLYSSLTESEEEIRDKAAIIAAQVVIG